MKKTALYIMMIPALAVFLAGCGKADLRQKAEAIPVLAMKVEARDIGKQLEYVGTIRGRDEAVVYPKVSGKIVEKVLNEGSPVKKGDPILYIDRDEVGLKFEKAPVESPLTGVLGRVYTDIGSNVSPSTPVAFVADMEGVEINLTVPEKYLHEVKLGQNAAITVEAFSNEKFEGIVTEVSPVLDIDTRSAPVEITIDDKDKKLRSGMFANIKLMIDEHKGVPVILKEAVIGKEPDTYVYSVVDNKAYFKKVKLGIRQGPYLEVLEGLNPGDVVVIMGQERLKDGADVTVELQATGAAQ